MREIDITIGRFSKFSRNIELSENESLITLHPFESGDDVFVITLSTKKNVRQIIPVMADEKNSQTITTNGASLFFVERKSLYKKTKIKLVIS